MFQTKSLSDYKCTVSKSWTHPYMKRCKVFLLLGTNYTKKVRHYNCLSCLSTHHESLLLKKRYHIKLKNNVCPFNVTLSTFQTGSKHKQCSTPLTQIQGSKTVNLYPDKSAFWKWWVYQDIFSCYISINYQMVPIRKYFLIKVTPLSLQEPYRSKTQRWEERFTHQIREWLLLGQRSWWHFRWAFPGCRTSNYKYRPGCGPAVNFLLGKCYPRIQRIIRVQSLWSYMWDRKNICNFVRVPS